MTGISHRERPVSAIPPRRTAGTLLTDCTVGYSHVTDFDTWGIETLHVGIANSIL